MRCPLIFIRHGWTETKLEPYAWREASSFSDYLNFGPCPFSAKPEILLLASVRALPAPPGQHALTGFDTATHTSQATCAQMAGCPEHSPRSAVQILIISQQDGLNTSFSSRAMKSSQKKNQRIGAKPKHRALFPT